MTIDSSITSVKTSKTKCKVNTVLEPTLLQLSIASNVDPDAISSREFGFAPFHQDTSLPHSVAMQVSIHSPGYSLMKELYLVFPDLQEQQEEEGEPLWVIPTFQKTHHDLVALTPQTTWERNLCCHYFYTYSQRVLQKLQERGCWGDYTDPADGYPVNSSRGSCLYPDVEGSVRLLRYSTIQVGCCGVLVHPVFGTRNYPATLFARGPSELVKKAVLSAATL